jgi:hypothetical protein
METGYSIKNFPEEKDYQSLKKLNLIYDGEDDIQCFELVLFLKKIKKIIEIPQYICHRNATAGKINEDELAILAFDIQEKNHTDTCFVFFSYELFKKYHEVVFGQLPRFVNIVFITKSGDPFEVLENEECRYLNINDEIGYPLLEKLYQSESTIEGIKFKKGYDQISKNIYDSGIKKAENILEAYIDPNSGLLKNIQDDGEYEWNKIKPILENRIQNGCFKFIETQKIFVVNADCYIKETLIYVSEHLKKNFIISRSVLSCVLELDLKNKISICHVKNDDLSLMNRFKEKIEANKEFINIVEYRLDSISPYMKFYIDSSVFFKAD